jgi:charged multivesicular body protein 2A
MAVCVPVAQLASAPGTRVQEKAPVAAPAMAQAEGGGDGGGGGGGLDEDLQARLDNLRKS